MLSPSWQQLHGGKEGQPFKKKEKCMAFQPPITEQGKGDSCGPFFPSKSNILLRNFEKYLL